MERTLENNEIVNDEKEVVKPVKKSSKKKATPKPVIGIVTDCLLLRVRSTAEVTPDNTIGEIKFATEVTVDLSASTDEFYKVAIPSENMDGYCMKKYINIGE